MSKEEKEIVERLGKEWGNFWISHGLEVYHRTSVDLDLNLREGAIIMIVDKILKKQVKSSDESNPAPYFIKGILCHWFTNGDYRTGTFHTKELLPASVVKQGSDTLADWLDRKK